MEIIAYKLAILFVVNVLLATVIFNLLYFKLRSYKDSGRPLRVLVLFSVVLLLKRLYKYTIKYHTVHCGINKHVKMPWLLTMRQIFSLVESGSLWTLIFSLFGCVYYFGECFNCFSVLCLRCAFFKVGGLKPSVLNNIGCSVHPLRAQDPGSSRVRSW